MRNENFSVEWVDSGREPKCQANPKYPEGIKLDISLGEKPACLVPIPYPAKRVGFYIVECKRCLRTAVCTTAGRADDPVSIRIPCNLP